MDRLVKVEPFVSGSLLAPVTRTCLRRRLLFSNKLSCQQSDFGIDQDRTGYEPPPFAKQKTIENFGGLAAPPHGGFAFSMLPK